MMRVTDPGGFSPGKILRKNTGSRSDCQEKPDTDQTIKINQYPDLT